MTDWMRHMTRADEKTQINYYTTPPISIRKYRAMIPTLNYDISYILSTSDFLYNKKDTDIEDGHEEMWNDSNVGSLP